MSEPRQLAALVVDDDITGRAFLRAQLKRAGYAVEIAVSGEEALEKFRPGAFDVVFMDMMMPGIDGVEATRHIKAAAGDVFTPVIFVTGAGDEESLCRAIDAGGDDFLAKPVTAGVLLAKLRAMERIRTLHERTRALYARVLDDQELAREVFERAVSAGAVSSPALRSHLVPAEVFSGDMLLSARSPEGRLVMMVGDFTGHGLAAALGALPVAEAFRSMASEGLAPELMLEQLNLRVAEALPRGHFLAACIVSVATDLASLTVANCGLPPLLLCGSDGVRERIESTSLALGIDRAAVWDDACRTYRIAPGERLVIASDGVTEACDPAGAPFGETRLVQIIEQSGPTLAGAPAAVGTALESFRAGTPFADDVSIVELSFEPALFGHSAARRDIALEVAA